MRTATVNVSKPARTLRNQRFQDATNIGRFVPIEVKIGFGRIGASFLLIALQQTEALATAIGSSGDRPDELARL